MNIPAKHGSALILLLCSAIPLWCQQASLGGLIKDRQDESPIPAADVLVNGKPPSITGVDGRYLVSGLKLGAKVKVTYKKHGYGARIEDVRLEHSRTDKDVALFKDTTDMTYWSAWSLKLRMSAEKEGSSSRYRK